MEEKLLTGYEAIIPGGGTMGKLIRSHDWSQTSVGTIENWSPSLKTALSIMLSSRFPMFIWWGQDESINFYNDAYIPILGARHPDALGQPAFQVWAEVWDTLSPQIEGVLKEGKAYWNEDYHVILHRNGYQEETYFTFSYSPIFSETGDIAGIFCAVTEDTRRVLNDRRIKTLRELAAETVKAKTVEDAGEIAIATLEHNTQDLPFALLYLLDETESLARLIATTESIKGMSVCPSEVELKNNSDDLWLLEQVLSGESQVIQLNESKYGSLPGGAWSDSPKLAVVLPITLSSQTVKGWVIAGVSPVREFDNDYQGFFDLIAGQIATAIANAQAYEAEKQRAEALAEIDRAKTTFFSNVSHEFRTPLTLMLSPLEDALFDTQEPLPPLQRQRIEVIQRNAMRLLKLVNTLLDFSRIEAGRIQAVYQPTDLATLTAELASVFRSAIEQSGMELVVDCLALPEAIYVDRDLWEKIVLNLISNAFKFTFSGSITIRLQWHESQVELSVVDTGIGIPAAELPKLFDRFYRVEGSRGRSIEGSGIGLSLVKELVELHNGTITATSTEGSGSCFTVAIPTGSAHLPSDRIGYDSSELGISTSVRELDRQESSLLENAPRSNTPLQIANNETPPNPVNSNTVNSTVRILVADDNADMRDYLERLLTPSYTIETVADGMTALNTIRNNPPDLVLSDVMMPEIDGFELLRSLRSEPQTQEIPIILLSARAGEESRIEGLEAGADDYLIKPFSTVELPLGTGFKACLFRGTF
jgi:signal transduction histidine kinase